MTGTALRNGLLKQALGTGACHECCDAEAAGRFTSNGDSARIAAKGCDVVLYPLQSSDLIQCAVNVRGCELLTKV